MARHTLMDILQQAAESSPDEKLTFYEQDDVHTITYSQLYKTVTDEELAKAFPVGDADNRIVILHLDSHYVNVLEFWRVIAAGGIPVVSTPFSADPVARSRHLHHLFQLFKDPLVVTTSAYRGEFDKHTQKYETITLRRSSIERLSYPGSWSNDTPKSGAKNASISVLDLSSVAFMMLTSGSTGGAKAVEITHEQILASMKGKSQMLSTSHDDAFLNWVGFDHVACLTEIHLHAMYVGAPQIHIEPSLAMNGSAWLQYLGIHSISITFAPNFFLASIVETLKKSRSVSPINLSHLRFVVSGGEANKVSTAIAFNDAMKELGAKHNVVCPAFGMTETCAGSLYNTDFPQPELQNGLEFCSVGKSIASMEWRIRSNDNCDCGISEPGNLQLNGPVVVKRYHNDPDNTKRLISSDGWFDTGDIGYRDSGSNLVLVGRSKDTIIINGVKYFSHEVEAMVEEAGSGLIKPSHTAAYPARSGESNTEEIVITFVEQKELTEEELLNAVTRIEKIIFLYCSSKPRAIIPLPTSFIEKSSIGKFSRSGMRKAYESGKFSDHEERCRHRISMARAIDRIQPETDLEKKLIEVFADELDLRTDEVRFSDSIIDMGFDSIRLLGFKARLQKLLGLDQEIPIGTLLTSPTIKSLAQVLSVDNTKTVTSGSYNPVIKLQTGKSKSPPIWFIHPGLGEILVFLNISRYFSDREVYALRAPGFNAGENMFTSIDEMTDVYMNAIRRHQANGPYILIGYSFGSMIAFETTKKLEAAGHEVYMASLNGPPHIKWRMVQIDWCELFLNLSYFLGFITEEEAVKKSAEFHDAGYTKTQVLDKILAIATPAQLAELDLDATKLSRWADISAALQGLAHNYDPVGKVKHIDVFYARPLLAVGKDKEVWLRDHLHPWNDFCEEPAVFHDSPGAHYTMLDADHVSRMQKVLKAALKARGV
uniref:Polyketide synthase n=1 Tax=Pestalotiopsis microspora TaxID=85828 RepID=A0A1P8NTL6_PESMI|nr:polyketide synthase [Pestalotiopsis microspora]